MGGCNQNNNIYCTRNHIYAVYLHVREWHLRNGYNNKKNTNVAFFHRMSKSKNHTNHNQIKKAHRNGIKKPRSYKYPSLRGVDSKFRRNHRYALHGTTKALAAKKAAATKA
ncbi:hypothetical protein HII13_003510 [Brettanomyces bruxellensis]|nr:hypothetical protein HII13_003510 [Brettanomyces bruxellensis]